MKVNSATTQPIQKKDVAGAAGAKRTDKGAEAAAASRAGTAAVDSGAAKPEISARAREFSQAKDVAAKAPDVREDRIAELKKKIASGNYQVNAQAIADKMVDEHMSTGLG